MKSLKLIGPLIVLVLCTAFMPSLVVGRPLVRDHDSNSQRVYVTKAHFDGVASFTIGDLTVVCSPTGSPSSLAAPATGDIGHPSWTSSGVTITLDIPKKYGESDLDWAKRARTIVNAWQQPDAFPPDPG